MPTVIDSLLITLGYDTSGLRRGQADAGQSLDNLDKASDKHAKAQAARSKAMADGFNKVKNEIVSMVAVLVGANSIKGFVADTVSAQAALGRMALNLGTSGRELDAWGAAVESVGGKKSDFQASAQAIAGTLEEIKATGNAPPAFMGAMNALNVSMLDAKGNMRDVSDIMGQINKGLQNRNLTEQDKMYLANALGLDAGTFNLLRQSPEKVQALIDKMRNLSGVSEDGAKVTEQMQEKWSVFKQSIDGLMTGAFIRVAPELERIMDSSERLADSWIGKLVPVIKDGAEWLGKLADKLTAVSEATGAESTIDTRGQGLFDDPLTVGERASNAWLGIKQYFGYAKDEKPIAPPPFVPTPAESAAPLGSKETWAKNPNANAMFSSLEKQRGLPSGLLDSVWLQESQRGNPKFMHSSAGAQGHFQFMPETAQAYGLKNPNDLSESADAASRYYAKLIKMFKGDTSAALAGYNWGEGNVQKAKSRYGSDWLSHAPAETRGYVHDITSRMGSGGASAGNTSSVSTNIQNMTINTQATTADVMFKDMKAALQRQAAVYSHAAGAQ
jgi:hypothetical protein